MQSSKADAQPGKSEEKLETKSVIFLSSKIFTLTYVFKIITTLSQNQPRSIKIINPLN